MISRSWALTSILALTCVGYGQTPATLSLEQAFRKAIDTRPEMAIVRAQLGSALARLQQARSGLLPSLLLQGAATNGPAGAPTFGPLENPGLLGTPPMSLEGLASDPLKKQYGAGLTLNQTIYDFGRTQHLVSARSNLVASAKEDASAQVAGLLLSVEQAYYDVLRAQMLVQVQEQNLKQREATLRQAKAFVEGQLRSGVDLQVATANAADARTSLVAAQNSVRYSFAELNNAMGDTAMTEYTLSAELNVTDADSPKSAEAAMALAVKQRPEVLSAAKQSGASDQLLKGVRSELSPRLDAIASIGAVNASSLIPEDKNYAVGIALSIPIFTGGYVEGRISEEKQRKRATEAQEQMVREAVRLQATKAWLDLQTRLAQRQSVEEQVKAAEKSRQLASERYGLQLSSIVELNEAELLAIQAETQLTESEYAVSVAQASLAWATGRTYQSFIRDGHFLPEKKSR